jgi:hypothetical protein
MISARMGSRQGQARGLLPSTGRRWRERAASQGARGACHGAGARSLPSELGQGPGSPRPGAPPSRPLESVPQGWDPEDPNDSKNPVRPARFEPATFASGGPGKLGVLLGRSGDSRGPLSRLCPGAVFGRLRSAGTIRHLLEEPTNRPTPVRRSLLMPKTLYRVASKAGGSSGQSGTCQ